MSLIQVPLGGPEAELSREGAVQRARLLGLSWLRPLLALLLTGLLLLLTGTTVLAESVTISDGAGVLDKARVQSEGAKLPYPLAIYTTNSFSGSQADFEARTQSHVTNSRLIVIAIDTVHHWMYIKSGSQVPLSHSAAEDAYNAFKDNYNNGDYTGATLAAIRSLESSLAAARSNEGGSPASSGTGGFLSGGLGTLCCIGLLVLIIGGIVFAVVRRRSGQGWGWGWNRPAPSEPYEVPPAGSYPGYPYQGPYQGGYPPNYYPPNQGGGMNPWAAGGLGALGGGLIGYELGKMAGEEEARQHEAGFAGDPGGGGGPDFGGGDFGGGAGGDFGGGGGGDFGGGDFGGGDGGSF
ncbi:hypothetical protein [Thermogemmatispora sp.]|uniref:hypothetical protein n=1 Tax=Thermogemmatispora sp. TaxID=1968838 RepID=UPI001E09C763|nr:hypothetical protein [Thermogemmatispora sp.]MBX5448508.1 hypothetical protein [Thermogemmatispora sp.]